MLLKNATLANKTKLTEDVIELQFKTNEELIVLPGQFINIKIEDENEFPCFRAYSICGEKGKNSFELCVKLVENGRGSKWLNGLSAGDKIEFLGPLGNMTLKDNNKDILFIATGTGVSPFKHMISTLLKNDFKKKIILLFGVRNENGIFYKEYFDSLQKKYENFIFLLTLSRPDEKWQELKGRVTDHLRDMHLLDSEIYVCGLNAMVEDVLKILENKNIPKNLIHFERFD